MKQVKDELYYHERYKKRFGGFARWVLPAYFVGHEIPDEPSYIVSNHLSLFDPVLIYLYTDGYKRYVSKTQTQKIFIFGKVLKNIGAIFIDREKEGGDISAVKNILKSAKNGENVVIYPEGTRNKKDASQVQPIKDGIAMFALRSKHVLVPMAVWKKQKLFSRNYVYVGKPFELEEFYSQKADAQTMEKARELIQQKMQETKTHLDELMANGGKKKIKRWYKEQRKLTGKKLFVISEQE